MKIHRMKHLMFATFAAVAATFGIAAQAAQIDTVAVDSVAKKTAEAVTLAIADPNVAKLDLSAAQGSWNVATTIAMMSQCANVAKEAGAVGMEAASAVAKWTQASTTTEDVIDTGTGQSGYSTVSNVKDSATGTGQADDSAQLQTRDYVSDAQDAALEQYALAQMARPATLDENAMLATVTT